MPQMITAHGAPPRRVARPRLRPPSGQLDTAVVPAASTVGPGVVSGHVLAVVRFDPARRAAASAPFLEVVAPFRQIEGEPLSEVWTTPVPPRRGAVGRVRFAATDAVLFGALEAEIGRPVTLEEATLASYTELLEGLRELGYPHLLRIWNAVPRINNLEENLERYMLFCRGRATAFERRFGPDFTCALPAASAVGCEGSRLAVHFIAARAEARHFENPRQVAAWAYPPQYGPRSPSFARATAAPAAFGNILFVSGTASVVGHASVHGGDTAAQLEETLRNISALLQHAGAKGAEPRQVRVYVRRAADAEALRTGLAEFTGGQVPLLFLRGDICREELLLEIELVV